LQRYIAAKLTEVRLIRAEKLTSGLAVGLCTLE
jgi:hypothetical protein